MAETHYLVKCENGESFVRHSKGAALKLACDIIEQEIAEWAGLPHNRDEGITEIERHIELGEYEPAIEAWRSWVNNGPDGKGEVIVDSAE